MLVMTRKNGETIRVGDEVVITLVRSGPTRVKIGVEAPDGMKILRGELMPFVEPTSDADDETSPE